MSPCAPNRTPPLVGAVLTAKRVDRHVRGRDRSHSTGDLLLKPCSLPCRAHQPAGADMNPCAPKRTPPLVGAVLTAKRMHRHVRGRDRSHGTGDFFWIPVQCMQGSPASGCRHESLHPEPHSSARGSGLGHEENAPARSRSRPLPQHRRLFLEPCSLPCRAHQPAGADMSPCTPNRTPPLVGAVLTAKRMHRHVRGRDRSHGTGDFFWVPVQHHAGLTSQRVPT